MRRWIGSVGGLTPTSRYSLFRQCFCSILSWEIIKANIFWLVVARRLWHNTFSVAQSTLHINSFKAVSSLSAKVQQHDQQARAGRLIYMDFAECTLNCIHLRGNLKASRKRRSRSFEYTFRCLSYWRAAHCGDTARTGRAVAQHRTYLAVDRPNRIPTQSETGV